MAKRIIGAEQAIDVVTIVAELFEEIGPEIAAIRTLDKSVSGIALAKLVQKMTTDSKRRELVMKLLEIAADKKLTTAADIASGAKALVGYLKDAQIYGAIEACVRLGILDRSDVTNFWWVLTAWSETNDRSRSTNRNTVR